MDISITCTDLRYLYELENNSRFDDGLGLELREEGIFVNPPDDLAPAARGEMEELVRSRHPTGNLSEPVLKFPCTLRDLKKFTDWAGHAGCIDAFRMARFIKHKDWELAQVAAQELGQYHSPIIHKVFALRERIER
ncbi:MAG TPA: hypothetical protein VJ833_11040, partial [Rhodanobacteraceae bacterium]|nr:hypothetical protein [Rhodanobacteraceae bacterium]